jgi:hypothetical protein
MIAYIGLGAAVLVYMGVVSFFFFWLVERWWNQ